MNRRRELAIVAFVATSVVRLAAEDVRDLAPLLAPVRESSEAPGIAAAIVRDGKLVGVGVTGVRRLGEPQPVERGDLLMIGSCGKALTRLLIGRLADKGLLRFDEPLSELLPDVAMRDDYKPVTIGQLLEFRGGIQPYTEIGPARTPHLFQLTGAPQEQRAAFVAHLLNEAPVAPPGTRFVYSNASYGLLGHLAERLSKRPFEELLHAQVFEPLGMKSAIVGMPNSAPERTGLYGHVRQADGYHPAPGERRTLPPIAPAGTMSMSIDDFARFAAQLVACETGKPGAFMKAETGQRLRAARPGGSAIEGVPFFGGDGWYTAAYALWPTQGVAIVVGTNAGGNDQCCQDTIEAVRAACAPELPSSPRDTAGPRTQGTPGRPRFGFMIRAEPDEWVVTDVVPGSPAEQGGLKAGDRVVALEGETLSSLDEAQRSARLGKSPLRLMVERDGKRLELVLHAAK